MFISEILPYTSPSEYFYLISTTVEVYKENLPKIANTFVQNPCSVRFQFVIILEKTGPIEKLVETFGNQVGNKLPEVSQSRLTFHLKIT